MAFIVVYKLKELISACSDIRTNDAMRTDVVVMMGRRRGRHKLVCVTICPGIFTASMLCT